MRLLALIVSLLAGSVSGARILALFPIPLYSHTHTFLPVFRELTARGHHITFLSPYPQNPAPENWTNIVVNKEPLERHLDQAVTYLVQANRYEFFYYFWMFCTVVMESAYEDEGLRSIVDSKTLDFDLIITEPLFMHESLTALGAKHNIPTVGVYPLSLTAWASYFTGNEFLPSYVPDYRTTYSDQMSFFERLDNTLLTIAQLLSGFYYYLPKQELLMEKYIYKNSKNHPPLVELLKNVPIHLIDTHYSLTYPRPHQPHSIPVGGLSIINSPPLPKDLQDYMDNSPNGVVYLSFGSHVPVSSLRTTSLNAMLKAFKSINVNVLMKWENDTLTNKPTNVMIKKWFPQASVLAHPKCRLFITHGGLHGISEATYYGIPMIGIPFFSDQLFNIKFMIQAGYGYQLLKEEITTENFKQAIETVLSDKSYKEKALRRSLVMRDRPDSARNTAVFWIEYALRHKDLSHLRPASAGLPLYQLLLLDVFAVLFLSLFLLMTIIYFAIKRTLKLFSRPKLPVKDLKKKKTK